MLGPNVLLLSCLWVAQGLKANQEPLQQNRTGVRSPEFERVSACVATYADGLDTVTPGLSLGAPIREIILDPFRRDQRPIVFSAGSGSTATHSFAHALREGLGMKGKHFDIKGGWTHALEDMLGNYLYTRGHHSNDDAGDFDTLKCHSGLNWFDYTKLDAETEFVLDEPADLLFLHLFTIFPNAKFLLHTRPAREWVKARRTHEDSLAPFMDPCGWHIERWNDDDLMRMEELKQTLVRCVVPKERLLEVDVFSASEGRISGLMREIGDFLGREVTGSGDFPLYHLHPEKAAGEQGPVVDLPDKEA